MVVLKEEQVRNGACDGLNKNIAHRVTGSGTIRGVALFKQV